MGFSALLPLLPPLLSYFGDRDSRSRDGKERPMTEGERYGFDWWKQTRENSPTRNYLGTGMDQLLRGINADNGPMAASPTFRSSYMSGQQMSQAPRIDFGQMPNAPFRTGPNANGPRPGGGGTTPTPGPNPPPGSPPNVGTSAGDGTRRGGNGLNPLNRMEPPDIDTASGGHRFTDELPNGGRVGEGIGNFLDRNPGGNVGAGLPGGGAGTQGPPPGMSYDEGGGAARRIWERIGPTILRYGPAVAATMIGLPPEVIQSLLDRFGNEPAPSGPGAIPGSISGGAGGWGNP